MKWFAWSPFAIIFLLWTTSLQAKIYTSPVLNEAAKLVEIDPKKSKLIAEKFLTQRKLTENSAKGPTSLPREDTDSTLRTPNSTIDAFHVLARSEFLLGKPNQALHHLENASQLAEQYQLPFIQQETKLLHAELLWRQTRDADKTNAILDLVETELNQLPSATQLGKGLYYQLSMQRGEVYSSQGQRDAAEAEFTHAQTYLASINAVETTIEFHLALGQHFLHYKSYDNALTELLTSYWKSIEADASLQLARSNYQLAQLFMQRQVLDKALEHLSGAADFYGNFEHSLVLADVLKQMADIYFLQGKYNLALVHYFNVLDHEYFARDVYDVIDLRLSIADTYLQLFNFTLAEQYLTKARNLVTYTEIKPLQARTLILTATLALQQNEINKAISNANDAQKLGKELNSHGIMQQSFLVLSRAYEKGKQYQASLDALKSYSQLAANQQERLSQINENVLRQQKDIIEQSLHYKGLEVELSGAQAEYRKFQRTAFGLFILSLIFIFITLRRGYLIDKMQDQLKALSEDLYTHTRSGLQNLRKLNIKLPGSLKRSSANFEQWQMGELINEPFSDRLRFAMFDLPFLRHTYLEQGYQAGLSLERAFGDYIATKITKPARLYHFSDAMFLYVEPNTDPDATPQDIFDKVCSWIADFEPNRKISRKVRVGMADYPFLPRAYTAINDQELIDILLMSTHLARSVEKLKSNEESQWVYLRAIENAPAASFASDNIRAACKQALHQGLIKAQSSCQNEEDIKNLTLPE